MKRNCLVHALLAAALVVVLGCTADTGVKGTAEVTGTVTMKGAPLAGAAVTFAPAPGSTVRAASATTDNGGKFKLTTLQAGDGAMPGDYLVTVMKNETVGKTYTQQEANEYYSKHMKSPPSPQIKNLVAEKFSKAETSGLKATVKKGEKNDFTFAVE